MSFQPLSFALGTLAVAALVFAAWKARARLIRLRVSTESQIEGTRRFIGRSADDATRARSPAGAGAPPGLASVRLTDILDEQTPARTQPVLAPERRPTAAIVFDVIRYLDLRRVTRRTTSRLLRSAISAQATAKSRCSASAGGQEHRAGCAGAAALGELRLENARSP